VIPARQESALADFTSFLRQDSIPLKPASLSVPEEILETVRIDFEARTIVVEPGGSKTSPA
jgi:hypothetical protein